MDPSSWMGTAHIMSTPLSGGFCCPVLSPQLPDAARRVEVAGSRAAFPCPETHPWSCRPSPIAGTSGQWEGKSKGRQEARCALDKSVSPSLRWHIAPQRGLVFFEPCYWHRKEILPPPLRQKPAASRADPQPSMGPRVLTHVPQLELTHGPLVRAALRQQVDLHLPVGDRGGFGGPVVITEHLGHR